MGNRLSKKVVGAALAGLVVAGAGAAAWAQTTAGTGSTSGTATTAAAGRSGHPGLAILRRADHGTLEVKDKDGKWVTVTFDRGRVTAADAGSVTIQRPDGQSATAKLTADTKYRGIGAASAITVGKAAAVVSDSGGNALILAQRAG
jgi:hypothetical protein